MKFIMIPVEDIDRNWDKCREMLKTAFRSIRNTHSVDDYYPHLKTGKMSLWLVGEVDVYGVLVTEISDKVLCVHSLSGKDLSEWSQVMDHTLTDYAVENGCQYIEAWTRRGFTKFFPGFVEDAVICVKKLGE